MNHILYIHFHCLKLRMHPELDATVSTTGHTFFRTTSSVPSVRTFFSNLLSVLNLRKVHNLAAGFTVLKYYVYPAARL